MLSSRPEQMLVKMVGGVVGDRIILQLYHINSHSSPYSWMVKADAKSLPELLWRPAIKRHSPGMSASEHLPKLPSDIFWEKKVKFLVLAYVFVVVHLFFSLSH